jgi:nucleoside 2-deoxyribosyltransferase
MKKDRRVYLAGPDVFFKDAKGEGEKLKKLCAEHGMEGVFPLDANIAFKDSDTPEAKGMKIFLANVELIRGCQAVLANMMPWRGPSTDPGTAWEMGFAFSRAMPVVGYTPDMRRYHERFTPDEYLSENFNLIDNLMLDCSTIKILPSAAEAVKYLASFKSFV